MNNILGILVSFGFVFLIIILSTLFTRYGIEMSRKFVHIALCNWWIIAMMFFDNNIYAAIVPFCFIVINYLSLKKNIFKSIERNEGKGDLGTVYYAISLFILALLTFRSDSNPIIGAIGILIMGYGDGLAALIGSKVKSPKLPLLKTNKSIAGSLTMFVVSFIVVAIILIINGESNLVPALIIALAATILEAVTPLGLDNLIVPLITALIAANYFI